MKKRFLRGKAVFIVSVFILSLFYSPVREVKAQYQENLGCCFVPESGECFINSFQSQCTEGKFFSDASCSTVNHCTQGCCVLGSQCGIKTKAQCELLTNEFKSLSFDFRPEIDLFSCADVCRQEEDGCCVHTDGTYIYGSFSNCQGEFQSGRFCSELENSPCELRTHTGCFNDEIWNLDSCGNKDKNSKGEGKPQKVCDFNRGLLCREKDGEAFCYDVNCVSTYSDDMNTHDPEFGGYRENGESWCVYEGPTGEYLDRPGSTHYRHECLNGEEIVEPCRDFREEVCVQGNSESSNLTTLDEFQVENFLSQAHSILPIHQMNQLYNYFKKIEPLLTTPLKLNPGFNSARCELNDIYDSSITQAKSTVPLGFAFWEFGGMTSLNFLQPQGGIVPQLLSGFGEIQGTVSTQLQEKLAQIPRNDLPRTESSRDGTAICAQGSLPPIKVKWKVCPLASDKCISNCFAEKQEFIDDVAESCSALGDCGVKYNVLGIQSPTGPSALDVNSFGGVRGFVTGKAVGVVSQFIGHSGYPPSFIVQWRGDAPGERPSQISAQKLSSWKNAKGVYKGMKHLSLVFSDVKKQIIAQGDRDGKGGFFSEASPLQKMAIVGGGLGVAGLGTSALLSSTAPTFAAGASITAGTSLAPGSTLASGTLASGSTLAGGSSFTSGTVALSTGETLGAGTGTSVLVPEGVTAVTQTGVEVGTAGATIGAEGGTTATTATAGVGGAKGGVAAITTLGVVAIIVIAIAVIVYFVTKCEYPTKTVTVSCNPWQAPDGSTDCHLCRNPKKEQLKNVDGSEFNTCIEYRCKSLGQACEFVETVEGPDCIVSSENDVEAPLISPDAGVLDSRYRIQDHGRVGYTIVDTLPAFEPVILAFKTNEPAMCAYETHHTQSYEEMTNFVTTLLTTKHNITIVHPPSNPQKEVTTEYFIRCKDNQGNSNIQEYDIKFTMNNEPDLTSPVITSFIAGENNFLQYGQTNAGIIAYVLDSSPIACRYSKESGKRYEIMEHEMICSDTRINDIHFDCTTTLANLTQNDNTFYFKCKDLSEKQNTMIQDYTLTLRGTQLLTVTRADPSPSGTIYYNTPTLAVVTSGGAENGYTFCSYIYGGQSLQFTHTGSTTHTQPLGTLLKGDYDFTITCKDVANNYATTSITFTVGEDVEKPRLIHTYKDSHTLFIILNEITTCEYKNQNFAFGQGYQMGEHTTIHSAPLRLSKYIIKCQDSFENDLDPIEIIP